MLAAYDFSPFATIADIGGGHGNILAAILRGHPAASGILFDQPHVVAAAGPYLVASGVADRCRTVGGDFFTDPLPAGADAYVLSQILHDWDDERCLTILRQLRRAIPDHGKLLVLELMLAPGDAPDPGKWVDLHMLVMASGAERAAAGYERLLRSAGFAVERHRADASPVRPSSRPCPSDPRCTTRRPQRDRGRTGGDKLGGVQSPVTRYARCGSLHIAYQVVGDGPQDLVYVPSALGHVETYWESPETAAFLSGLASFARLILLDKRGTGMSDRVVGAPTMEERIDDVRAVMAAAGSTRAALYGMSEGGAIGALFAATYPEAVSHLVLMGTGAVGWVTPERAEELILTPGEQLGQRRDHRERCPERRPRSGGAGLHRSGAAPLGHADVDGRAAADERQLRHPLVALVGRRADADDPSTR